MEVNVYQAQLKENRIHHTIALTGLSLSFSILGVAWQVAKLADAVTAACTASIK